MPNQGILPKSIARARRGATPVFTSAVVLLTSAATALDAQDTTKARTSLVPPTPGIQATQSGASAQGTVSAVTPTRAPADSVRPYLVFRPRDESWFVVASRGKRMLLDIGRVDVEVRKDSALAQAFREVAAQQSPVPVGTRFTLRGPWGVEDVQATGVDTWNGRIVLVLQGSAAMDSAAQGKATVSASAVRLPEPAKGTALRPPLEPVQRNRCDRTPISGVYAERVRVLRDSLDQSLREAGMPIYERLAKRVTTSHSVVTGCFGSARALLAVSLRAGNAEWTRERVVLVDTLGHAVPLAVADLRFRVHDLLHAADFDGDGLDDVAAVGRTHRAGGTTLLKFDAEKKRLVRLAAGFVWEDM